jgi:adenine-specific DNA-methyltransferase
MSIEKLRPKYIIDEERLKQIKQIAPECFADGKINWEMLKEALGNHIEEESSDAEHFGLFWPGKREARKKAGTPSRGTLVPVPSEGVDEETTCNIFIEGENLDVLKLLQKSYAGRIKMIYIDPPYNTGNDLIYDDNFTETMDEFLNRTGQIDEEGRRLTTNNKADGRFHSKWLSMIYPRLRLARNLLKEDGVIFISIDNNEVHNLRAVANEIFGEENFIECICWNKRIPKNDKGIGSIHEYILIYVKNNVLPHEFIMQKDGLEEIDELLTKLKKAKMPLAEAELEIRKFYKKKGYDRGITLYNALDENYKLWGKINMSWPNADTFGPRYTVLHPGNNQPVKVPERGWRWKEETFNEAAERVNDEYVNVKKLHDGSYVCGRIWFSEDENTQPSSINYLEEVDTFLLRSILSLKSDGGIEVEKLFSGKSFFSYPKPTSLLKVLFKSVRNTEKEIFLDFFSGSCTTAQAILDLNAEDAGQRKFICVQLPEATEKDSEAFKAGLESIAAIGKERIRKSISALRDLQSAKGKMDGRNIGDLGFRYYKLRPSNYKNWENMQETNLEKLESLFDEFESPLIENWKEEDLLTEILLMEGFPLDSSIRTDSQHKKNTVKLVASDYCEHRLVVCLDTKVSPESITTLRLQENDIFICLDSAITDEQKLTLSDKGLIKTI